MFYTILFIFVLLSISVVHFVFFRVYVLLCILFLLLSYPFPIFYKSTDRCHSVEKQLQ